MKNFRINKLKIRVFKHNDNQPRVISSFIKAENKWKNTTDKTFCLFDSCNDCGCYDLCNCEDHCEKHCSCESFCYCDPQCSENCKCYHYGYCNNDI